MKKERKKKRSKQEKGITLVALVVTIIILLILAGVTLNGALSENGLFKRAKYAAEEYNKKSIEEEIQLKLAEQELDSVNGTNRKADITSVLEEMVGDREITEDDIDDFNKYLEKYGEKIIGISTEEEFKKIGVDEEYPLDGNYVQTGDFALTNPTTMQGGTIEEDGSVTPNNPFKGVYNGNRKKINNLTINNDTEPCTGMFGYNEGTVKNVTIDSCTITSTKGWLGTIAGVNTGMIENCNVKKGNICYTGKADDLAYCIGGICGDDTKGLIQGCSNWAEVDGKCNQIGGICGSSWNGIVENCKNYRYSKRFSCFWWNLWYITAMFQIA